MEVQLEYSTRCVHVFARLAPTCMLGRCLLEKFLHRSSVESLLRVPCWLGPGESHTSKEFEPPCSLLQALKKHYERDDVEIDGQTYSLVVEAVNTEDGDSQVGVSVLPGLKKLFLNVAKQQISCYKGLFAHNTQNLVGVWVCVLCTYTHRQGCHLSDLLLRRRSAW